MTRSKVADLPTAQALIRKLVGGEDGLTPEELDSIIGDDVVAKRVKAAVRGLDLEPIGLPKAAGRPAWPQLRVEKPSYRNDDDDEVTDHIRLA